MIKVQYSKNEIEMSGHANFSESGSDIVCAGASMLVYAVADKMLSLDKQVNFIEDEKGYIKLSFNGASNELELLYDTLINGLKMLESQYPKNINIMEAK